MTQARAVPSVRTVETPGTWRPTALQELLLDAALGDRERAAAAFAEWVAATGFDDVDGGSFRVLPLVATRFEELGITGSWSAHLRGVLRRSWYENHVMLHATLPAIDELQRAGIDVVVLKGGALGVLAYPGIGSRPMDDLDVLVPEGRAVDALRVLLRAGWRLDPEAVPAAVCRGDLPESFRRLRHSIGMHGPAGFDVDLHWHAAYAWCWLGADRDLWATTRSFELHGRSLRALSASDELIVDCVHGLRANRVPPIRWVTDAMMVLRSEPLAWDALVRRARDLRVEPHLGLAFEYLRARFAAPIPDSVLGELRERKPGVFEREWFTSRTEGRSRRTLTAHYGGYLRGARGDSGFRRYAGGLPRHLVFLLGCETTAELPGEIARRSVARLRRQPT